MALFDVFLPKKQMNIWMSDDRGSFCILLSNQLFSQMMNSLPLIHSITFVWVSILWLLHNHMRFSWIYLNLSTGCSLLHWAAINNRGIIAALLIQNGAIIDKTGGALGETPLQWAINKKYYTMIQLLILRGLIIIRIVPQ